MKSQKSLRRAVVLLIFMVAVSPMSPFRAMARGLHRSGHPQTPRAGGPRRVQGCERREAGRLYPGAGQGAARSVRRRDCDGGRGNLYRRRRRPPLYHPIGLQAVHGGARDAGAGDEAIEEKIGVEPTGQKFNSILATQIIEDISANPLVNSGAIAAVSMVRAKSAGERFNKILKFDERLAGTKLNVIEEVYKLRRPPTSATGRTPTSSKRRIASIPIRSKRSTSTHGNARSG